MLFIDEAYYLYRPDNERDYGQEGIEIFAAGDVSAAGRPGGDPRRLWRPHGQVLRQQIPVSCRASPTTSTRRTSSGGELLAIAELMLHDMNYKLQRRTRAGVCSSYIAARKTQPLFLQRPLDPKRARSNTAAPGHRLVADLDRVMTAYTASLEAADVLASRVFSNG